MPKDFRMDQNGNLRLDRLVEGIEFITQSLWIRLGLFKGDWFMNNQAWVDYDLVLGHVPPKEQQFYAQMRAVILSTWGVNSILSFTPSLNTATRVLTVAFKVDTVEGEIEIDREIEL